MLGQYITSCILSRTRFKTKTQQYVLLLKHGLAMMRMTLDIKKSHHLDTKPCPDLGKMERGGGITVVYKASLNIKECSPSTQTSEIMEHMELTSNFRRVVCNIYIIYCIPNMSVIQFCSELSNLIENNILEDHGHLIMLGDFNIHMDKPEHPDIVTFNDFLESFDLVNYTTFPTHLSTHTLDLVITNSHGLIKSTEQGHYLSDHCFVDIKLHLSRTEPIKKQIKFCKLKNISSAQLHLDLRACLEDHPGELDDQVDQYNTKLQEVLDKHAPITEKKIRDSHHQPWFSDKIKMKSS